VRGSDFLLLVTEPTPFGLHDLRLAAQVAGELGIPAGVIINRENGSYPALDEFCASLHLPVLMRIPFERTIAEGVAQGKTLVEIHPETIDLFIKAFTEITLIVL
jgi:MinD superfamily P-loop ATPase